MRSRDSSTLEYGEAFTAEVSPTWGAMAAFSDWGVASEEGLPELQRLRSIIEGQRKRLSAAHPTTTVPQPGRNHDSFWPHLRSSHGRGSPQDDRGAAPLPQAVSGPARRPPTNPPLVGTPA